MKIRTDFVTNSSSSCFAEIRIDNPVLLEILKKYKEMGAFVRQDGYDHGYMINCSERGAHQAEGALQSELKGLSKQPLAIYLYGEAEYEFAPSSLEEVVFYLFQVLADEEFEEELKNPDAFSACIKEVAENLDKINSSYKEVLWETSIGGWGEYTAPPQAVGDAENGWSKEWTFHYKEGGDKAAESDCKEPFEIENGVLKKYNGTDRTVVIPDGVTKIGDGAFENNHDRCYGDRGVLLNRFEVADITIPDSVTEIGKSAFAGCKNLTSIAIPEDVTEISEGAFSGCVKLSSISIPKGVKTIGRCAFAYCESLTSIVIPENVIEIAEYAFADCSKLSSISIPKGVKTIGKRAFASCESLTSVVILGDATEISEGAFSHCVKLSSISISKGVKTIEQYAFWGCKSLTNIIIPDGVNAIAGRAFSECHGLESITVPASVQKFGTNVFLDCPNLVLYAPAGSAAIRYAKSKKNNIPFEVISDAPDDEAFPAAMPDEELFPHYANKDLKRGIPGVKVVSNPHGPDYQFLPLRNILNNGDDEDEDEDEREERLEIQECVKRILAKDTEQYDLDKLAETMRPLFHVSPQIFDENHDRECEIAGGYIHRAYMMSALRSVAWTLAAYCKEKGMMPEQVEEETLVRMVDFAANQEWLNYDGTTYCQGLCGSSDLHVFFLPDSAEEADRQAFLPSEEEKNSVREMKERLPNYNELLPTVHSLTALRKDLVYVYPAVRCLHDRLKRERDEAEWLTGNEADIVYAWCALATAAKEPFFSEDGPMQCHFTQLPPKEIAGKTLADRDAVPVVKRAPAEQEKSSPVSEVENGAPDWKSYLDPEAKIEFQFKCFAFTGMPSVKDEQNHAVVQAIRQKDGFYRTSVSGATDYLVIGPRSPALSKVRAAIEQIEKGRGLKIVRLQDVERALAESTAEQSLESTPKSGDGPSQKTEADMDGAVESKYDIPVDHTVLPPQDPATSAETRETMPNAAEENASVPQTTPRKKEGCYIATAVYGSYDAPEVLILRRFRDERLQRTSCGRAFIRLYYQLSPAVAQKLKKARRINSVIKHLLDRWVKHLEKHW